MSRDAPPADEARRTQTPGRRDASDALRRSVLSLGRPLALVLCSSFVALQTQAQVPVFDAGRLRAQQGSAGATHGSKTAKPSTKAAAKGTGCTLSKAAAGGGGAGNVAQGAILNRLSGASDFASLEPTSFTGDVTQSVGAAGSEALGAARKAQTTLSSLGTAVQSNVSNLTDVGSLAGSDGRTQDSWDRNTAARLQQGQVWNQAIGGAEAQARLLQQELQAEIVRQSQSAAMLTYDRAANPFTTQPAGAGE